jgi:hypothetical protein
MIEDGLRHQYALEKKRKDPKLSGEAAEEEARRLTLAELLQWANNQANNIENNLGKVGEFCKRVNQEKFLTPEDKLELLVTMVIGELHNGLYLSAPNSAYDDRRRDTWRVNKLRYLADLVEPKKSESDLERTFRIKRYNAYQQQLFKVMAAKGGGDSSFIWQKVEGGIDDEDIFSLAQPAQQPATAPAAAGPEAPPVAVPAPPGSAVTEVR